jgi:glutamine cyclotransferase
VYDKNFNLIRKFHYFTEGWGLTHYKNHLVLSDGSNRLYFLNPQNFRVEKQLEVFEGKKPLFRINEMETIGGKIFANIWESERIAIIHPETGQVIAWLNLKGLLSPQERENAGVLNGIAYIPEKNQILITGKNWPRLFVIALTSPF